MSPTLYTARNNGKENNGGNTTMVTITTMINNGIMFRVRFQVSVNESMGWKYRRVGLGEGGLLAMWWDIQGIAWTECIWSHGAEIFHWRGWLIEVSPYIHPPSRE